MDSPELAVGLCCSFVPLGGVALVAWLARSKAEDAMKEAAKLRAQLNVLQLDLAALRKRVLEQRPPPSAPELAGPPLAPTLAPADVEAPAPEVAAPALDVAPPAPTAPMPAPPPEVTQPLSGWVAEPAAPPPPRPPVTPRAPPPRPPPPPRKPAQPIEWEKWIGIRGAAVLGGIVFAMAGVYLFRYSVQQGWISPAVRVASAMFAGVAALVAGQRLRARYQVTAQALSGGGIVVLYAGTWAAKALYELIPLALAFVLMVLVTAAAGVLAVRQQNRLVAYLGLVGGFATPLLLSTGQNAPLPLFTYVLLLDLGLLYVAAQTKWRSVSALALVGTTLLELGWIFTRMEADQAWIAFSVLALFSVLFAAMTLRGLGDAPMPPLLRAVLTGALFVPVLALAYFAGGVSLEVPQLPTAGFLAVLTLGVGWVHRRGAVGEPALLTAAAFSSLAVLGLFAMTRHDAQLTWWLLGSVLLVTAPTALNVLWPQDAQRRAASLAAARLFLLAVPLVLLIAAVRTPGPSHLSFSVGIGVTGLLLAWLARDDEPAWQWLLGVLPALWMAFDVAASRTAGAAEVYVDAAETLGPSGVLALSLLAMNLRARIDRVVLGFTIATLSWCLLLSPVSPPQPLQVLAGLGVVAALGLVTAVRFNRPVGAFVLVLLYGARLAAPLNAEADAVVPWAAVVVLGAVFALAFHALLVWAPARFHTHRFGAVAGALVLPAAFPGLLLAWRAAWGPSMQGLLPVLLAVVAVASARLVRPVEADRRVMWLLAGAATLLAIAVPLQLENQWVTLSWALMGLGYVVLWKRFDSRGLKWLASTLLTLVTIRLLLNPEVLRYAHPSGVPLVNWLSYTYLVPAVCLLAVGSLLQPLEVLRARGWEKPFYSPGVAWVASSSVISAALVVFAWVTLSVLDFYSDRGGWLSLAMERLPARDLTLSVAWILYAVGLLAVGMLRRAPALRWMSLGFLLISIGKVFLYDLGELKDLYRVASLLGLAISLIGISLAYQRFVFRRTEENQP